MNKDVILNKSQTIAKCTERILEEYAGRIENLQHITKQDSIILNLQRTCEAAIDLAMHVIAERGMGIPQSSRNAFEILEQHQIIDSSLSGRMKAMVGFRNIAVHDYQALQLEIIQAIIENHLEDFHVFALKIKALVADQP